MRGRIDNEWQDLTILDIRPTGVLLVNQCPEMGVDVLSNISGRRIQCTGAELLLQIDDHRIVELYGVRERP